MARRLLPCICNLRSLPVYLVGKGAPSSHPNNRLRGPVFLVNEKFIYFLVWAFLFKTCFYCMCVCTCLYTGSMHVQMVTMETRRGCWLSWSWNYRRLFSYTPLCQSACGSFKIGSPDIPWAGLKSAILLPQLPKGWDYRHA